MTLNLSFTFDDAVLQVSDRRMTDLSSGKFDDYANKAVISDWDGGGFCMTFAGIGSAPPLGRIDNWAHSTLADLYKQNIRRADDAMNTFRETATTAFKLIKKVSLAKKHHAFVLGGWYNHPEHGKRPYLCLISNFHKPRGDGTFEALQKPFPHFNSFPLDGSGRRIVTGLFNDFNANLDQEVLPITRAYKQGKIKKEDLSDRVVEIVRRLADTPEARGTVGKHCLSVYWEKNTVKVAKYHDADGSTDTFGPLYFGHGMSVSGIKGWGVRKESIFSTGDDKPSSLLN